MCLPSGLCTQIPPGPVQKTQPFGEDEAGRFANGLGCLQKLGKVVHRPKASPAANRRCGRASRPLAPSCHFWKFDLYRGTDRRPVGS